MSFDLPFATGGQETTAMTAVTQLAHHGMVFVPLGYTNPDMMNMDAPKGGSAWGSGTLAGPDGSRQPSELELGIARHHGKQMAEFVKRLG